jgi:FKBP-type peptidyl-prolyl cis-trans isomerase SlyD
MFMAIENESVVSFHFTLKNDGGEVLDSSSGSEPLTYLHGFGNIIPGLEAALEGKNAGDKFQITLKPEDGYGERDERLVQTIPRNQFPDTQDLQVGMQFQIRGPQGPMILTVMSVNAQEVVVDGNPELAGQTLHFDEQITEVRKATKEELEQGHAHGPGDSHHD